MKRLFIITPIYEDAEASAELFQQLSQQYGRELFVVAVDDGSVPYTFLAIALMTFFWVWGSTLEQLMQRLEPAVKVFVVFVFVFFSYRYALVSFSSPGSVLTGGFQPLASGELTLRKTDSGLVVYQPASGDQCFDAPLPCAPGFDPRLQLIKNAGMFPTFYFTTMGLQD